MSYAKNLASAFDGESNKRYGLAIKNGLRHTRRRLYRTAKQKRFIKMALYLSRTSVWVSRKTVKVL